MDFESRPVDDAMGATLLAVRPKPISIRKEDLLCWRAFHAADGAPKVLALAKVPPAALETWDTAAQRFAPAAGEFAVFVGTSSRALPLGATFAQDAGGKVSLRGSAVEGAMLRASAAAAAAGAPAVKRRAGSTAATADEQHMMAQQQQLAVEQAFSPQADAMAMAQ